MSFRLIAPWFVLAAVLSGASCQMRGKPAPGPEVPRPDSILNSKLLYDQNCAGCHGADGHSGAAMALGNPVYLAIVSDDTLRSVASKGRAGTAMSAFAQKEGGMLTDAQVDAIVHGIRQRWSKPGVLAGGAIPPYAATSAGDVERGAAAYATFCASCHGAGGAGGPKAGSIIDPAYLSLITDQGLRSIVIVGRPDFNAPDWRDNLPGHPMTDQEITDVVAWLASHRPVVTHQQNAAASASPLAGGSQ